jgi:hypothetical protein
VTDQVEPNPEKGVEVPDDLTKAEAEPGEGVPPDSAEEAHGVGQKVIGELRERRET